MSKKDWLSLFLIIALPLIVAFFYLKFGMSFPVKGDTAAYYDPIAINLVSGKGFAVDGESTARVAPGYPFFLAFSYSIFGHDYLMVRVLQFLLLAGIGISAYFIGKKYLKLPFPLPLLSSLTIVLWPYFILYSTLILTEILFTFFLILSVYFSIKFWREGTYKTALVSGAILGIAMLIRPLILLLPIWIGVFLFIFEKTKKGVLDWKKIAVFIFMAFVIISPWTVRNFLQFNSFIPISTGLDKSLKRAFITYDYTQDSVVLEPGEANLKSAFVARLKNIYLFWNPGVEGERAQALTEKYPQIDIFFLIYKIVFFIILGAAFLSLRFIRRKEIFLLWTVIFYFWSLHTILYPYPRYTLPIIPLVILLSFVAINGFVRLRRLKLSQFRSK
ncbi:MAG: glycosyltransferase family 39 protein [Patescibacteria group bacterium]|nr:glycosyltransferase family 39 protein [Patescibacteria group bacterium]